MENIVQNVIKKQNKELLITIAKEYKLGENKLIEKYFSPTYYGISIDETKKYKITKK